MYPRFLAGALDAALADTPVVLLRGARQCGKTTLARQTVDRRVGCRYLSLDDIGILATVRKDPAGFVASLSGPVVIDEVQRAPELFLPIKVAVDSRRNPGQFLLTGSADVMLSPRLSDTLAGRMELLNLWPLSQGERERHVEGFVDAVFEAEIPFVSGSAPDLLGRVLDGGYPEVMLRPEGPRRSAWFRSYVSTVLERDVRDLARIDDLSALPGLLHLLAARAAGLVNYADLSRAAQIPQTTLKRYLALMIGTFLVWELPAWSANLGKRFQKSPKLMFGDTGLLAFLRGMSSKRLMDDRHNLGPVLESFVATEIRKQVAWSDSYPALHHFRTHAGHEVDLVLETPDGRLVGIETKAAGTVYPGDFAGLRALAAHAGERFHRGIVLYTGKQTVPVAPNLHALPVEALWTLGARAITDEAGGQRD